MRKRHLVGLSFPTSYEVSAGLLARAFLPRKEGNYLAQIATRQSTSYFPTLMSVFAQIESRLLQCAAAQQAVLTQNREGMSVRFGFEERRIDWQQDGINRAIIIQPDFLATGVDTTKWNFRAVAWQGSGHKKRTAGHDFATSLAFEVIEGRIESLLAEACAYLQAIRASDLQPLPYMRGQ